MNAVSANEAKTNFGSMLLKAQQAPIQINKNGKPVVVMMSADDYEHMGSLKLQMLQARAVRAKADIAAGNLVAGDAFFTALQTGHYD